MAATENDEERNLPFQHRLTVKAAGRVASVKVTLINIRDIFQNFKGPRNKSIAHPNTVLCSCGVAVLSSSQRFRVLDFHLFQLHHITGPWNLSLIRKRVNQAWRIKQGVLDGPSLRAEDITPACILLNKNLGTRPYLTIRKKGI